MGSAIRVLQAADLCLHEPLEAVGRLPAHLREIFNQARERSALKVFNAALTHEVDLLLLCGSLAEFDVEPRLACFLMEQFRRLQEAGVSILWATEKPTQLPSWALRSEHVTCMLPGQSVRVFSLRSDHRVQVQWPSATAASINGLRLVEDAAPDLFVTMHEGPQISRVDYSETLQQQSVSHSIIPVQPVGSADQKTSGAWLIESQPGQKPQLSRLETASVSWAMETIDLQNHASRTELLEEIQHRMRCIQADASSMLVCLHWELTGTSPVWEELIRDRGAQQLHREVRDFSDREAQVWCWKITLVPSADQFQQWSESPAIAQGFRQLEQLSTADLAASASAPAVPGCGPRRTVITHREVCGQRIRLVRELSGPETQSGIISINS